MSINLPVSRTKPLLLAVVVLLLLSTGCESEKVQFPDVRSIGRQIEAAILHPEIPENVVDLPTYLGQSPDESGSFDFRPGIQRLIDSLSATGGGVIYFSHPQGRYTWTKQIVTYTAQGPLHLKSNIELRFDVNVRLFFPFDPEAYMLPGGTLRRYEGTMLYGFSPLIYAFNAKNIALVQLSGSGVPAIIDGDGMRWQQWAVEQDAFRESRSMPTSYRWIREINHQQVPLDQRRFTDIHLDVFRPELMSFLFCERIAIRGLQIENAPFWMIHPVFSRHISMTGLTFHGPVVNNDAFDPESSDHVLIAHNVFNNHDDNVAIKAGRDLEGRDGLAVAHSELAGLSSPYINQGLLGGPTTNVVIRNNDFKGHHAVSIGSEMSGGVSQVYIFDNISTQNVYNALYLKSSRKRGGYIREVYMQNNHFNRVGSLITMIPNYDRDTISPFIPKFESVFIDDLTAQYTDRTIRITGWKELPIENIHLSKIRIREANHPALELNNLRNLTLHQIHIGDSLIQKNIDSLISQGAPVFHR